VVSGEKIDNRKERREPTYAKATVGRHREERTDDRGQKTEDRRQRTEDGGYKYHD
jgi:hypothetical protein